MDSQPDKTKWKWSWLIPLVCAAVVVAWLVETPEGLLGKADAIGYAVCHRISVRSFFLADRQLPLCARCSGMYIGAVVGIFYQVFRYPRRGGMLTWKTGIPFILFFLAWAFDGSNSYLHLFPGAMGLYQPNNILRLVTGIGMGLSMAAILAPAFQQTVWKTYDERGVFISARPYIEIILIAFACGLLFLTGNSLILYPLALISAGGVLLVLSSVYTLIWLMVVKKVNYAESWKDLVIPLSAGLLTAIIQIAAVDALRYWLTGTWNGFHL
jgi:uncharacterized membrane protein